MSLPKELLDAKGLSEGASLGPHISAIRASYRCSSLNLDDYVGDYRPIPIWGCLRTYKISSSGDPTIKLDRYFEEFEGSFETPISEKPGDLENFAVVSVRVSPREIRQDIESKKGPGCKIGMKEVINLLKIPSRPTLDEHSAVETLLSKLANEAPFTYDKTIQAAISAIQRLYHHALFQDDEIEVHLNVSLIRQSPLLLIAQSLYGLVT